MLPSLGSMKTKVVPSPSFEKVPLKAIEAKKGSGNNVSKLTASKPLIHENNIHSGAYHQVLDDLEDKIGRSATHDEVVKELTRKLKHITSSSKRSDSSALDLLETNVGRSQNEIGDDIKQWKPDDYMHHEQFLKDDKMHTHESRFARSKEHEDHPSNIKRAGTLARVVVFADPGLGDVSNRCLYTCVYTCIPMPLFYTNIDFVGVRMRFITRFPNRILKQMKYRGNSRR
jgi:hypothetical protein